MDLDKKKKKRKKDGQIFNRHLWKDQESSLKQTLGKLTQQFRISPRNKGLSSKKMLVFPPVAAPCVNVCGCMCAGPDGLITVASELSGRLSSHPPPHL